MTSNRYRGRFLGSVGPTSSGSGFIVTADGMILTNAHVVADAHKVHVKLPNGVKYEGIVIDIDPVTDLAAVQLTVKNVSSFIDYFTCQITEKCTTSMTRKRAILYIEMIMWTKP